MKFPIPLLASLLLALPLLAEKPDPKSLELTKWTPDFQVPDPVAISFDEKGRAYVTQTQRRKANDLDIRNNRDWIPNDLSFESPDDKRAFYRKNFTPQNSSANQNRVKDFNQDGKHDLLDLQALSERIHLIEDTDGDGFADKSSLYAEDFQDEIAGIAAGVLHHEGDVYTTIVPDVWKLRDTDGDGKADQREVIATGFGVHLAYAGHDMHGLTVGPDGRIYWTVGDKGLSVKSKEGEHFKYPNQGAVLRCDPDGSNFEVYARGLRNVQELAFDQFGNLFGIDNDSDRPGEKERFIYIVQHMDAGWRSNWQYRGTDFNPWMDENLSVPWQENQPAYILPPISLYENGPAGLAFNPGTALGEEWQNYFFHTSAPNGQQWAFQVEQNGASFKMVHNMQIGNGVPIVGINFGPDGALYGVDWGGGYPLNQKGAIWKWDVEKKHPLREETARLLRADFSEQTVEDLITKLNHADQRVRLKAQFELVKRNAHPDLLAAAEKGPQISRVHAIWGLGQIIRRSHLEIAERLKLLKERLDRIMKNWPESPEEPDPKPVEPLSEENLFELLEDPDPEIRVQVAKILGDDARTFLSLYRSYVFPGNESHPLLPLEKLLQDNNDRVKFHAAVALGNLAQSQSVDPILAMARSIKNESQTYLRHAAIVGLTGCASPGFLSNLVKDESELIQKIAVVALRRRHGQAVCSFLNSPFENVVAEAARAIHDDWTVFSNVPDLGKILNTTPWIKNESIILRSINANFRGGLERNAKRVATFATRQEAPLHLRLNALEALEKWSQPEPLDRVVGRYRPLKKRDQERVKNALIPHLDALLTDPSPQIQSTAMKLARSLKVIIGTETLVAVLKKTTSPSALRVESLRAFASQKHPQLPALLESYSDSNDPKVAIAALDLLAQSDPTSALRKIAQLLPRKEADLFQKQAAIDLLAGKLASEAGDKIILAHLDKLPAALQLNLLEAAATRKLEAPSPEFSHTLQGGDAVKGHDLFMNHLAAQCIRCHKVSNGKGSDIGPNLKAIGSKKRGHLLESLIDPQKEISGGFGTISLTLESGKTVAGLFQSEKNGVLKIRDPDGKITKIKSAEVKERSPVLSTMPPMGAILSKREIRDIIAYLATLKPEK